MANGVYREDKSQKVSANRSQYKDTYICTSNHSLNTQPKRKVSIKKTTSTYLTGAGHDGDFIGLVVV